MPFTDPALDTGAYMSTNIKNLSCSKYSWCVCRFHIEWVRHYIFWSMNSRNMSELPLVCRILVSYDTCIMNAAGVSTASKCKGPEATYLVRRVQGILQRCHSSADIPAASSLPPPLEVPSSTSGVPEALHQSLWSLHHLSSLHYHHP